MSNQEYENPAFLEEWLKSQAKADVNFRDNLDAYKKELKHLDLSGQKIIGIFKIEDFPKLKSLNLGDNELTSLEINNCPSLEVVNCSHNEKKELKSISESELTVESRIPTLEKLTIENCPNVKELYCAYNKLTELDTSGLNLRFLDYSNNNWTSTEQAKLDKLVTDFNIEEYEKSDRVPTDAQTWLDKWFPIDGESTFEGGYLKMWEEIVDGKTKIKSEYVPYKGLKREEVKGLDISKWCLKDHLDLRGFTALEELDCSNNYYLTSLSLDDCPKLKILDASRNQLTWIAFALDNDLETISLYNNKLTYLDLLESKKIKTLSCSHNKLKELDLTGLTKLEGLYCSNNKLKELDLNGNAFLKHLVCDNNPIKNLEIKHLKDLESLYCFKCCLADLDCSGLENLKELYCAWNKRKVVISNGDSTWQHLKLLDVLGCNSLEILDCAENDIANLNITNLPKLKTISCKENCFKKLTINDCNQLEYLDFSRISCKESCFKNLKNNPDALINQLKIHESGSLFIDANSTKNLKKLFHSKSAKNVPDWRAFPKLEKLGVGKSKPIEFIDECGEEQIKWIYFVEEINVIGLRNTEKINQLLAKDEEDITLEELEKIEKEDLHGVPVELRNKLIKLGIKKLKERFLDEGYGSNEEEDLPTENDTSLSTPPSEDEKEEEISSVPKKNKDELDYKKLYLELLEKVKKGEITLENKELITNSPLSEENKEELYKLLANQNTNQENQPTTNYLPWILGSLVIILVIGMAGYLLARKRKKIILPL